MTLNIKRPPSVPSAPLPVRAIRKLWRLAVDRPYRNMMWLFWTRPNGAFQPFNETRHDRYPYIFSFVHSALGAESKLKILSFGCSRPATRFFRCVDIFPTRSSKASTSMRLTSQFAGASSEPHRTRILVSRRQLQLRQSPRALTTPSSPWPCCATAVSGCPASPDATI
jgi:hypothetical protein